MKRIKDISVAVFYDVPLIIIGREEQKYYIALLYDITDDGDLKFTATHVNEQEYDLIVSGEIELREAICTYDTYFAGYEDDELVIQDEIINPTEYMLPEPGFSISDYLL